ncbi:MAG: LVIVD repeat-containing protein [Candidatus Hodarchaeota archaeon]
MKKPKILLITGLLAALLVTSGFMNGIHASDQEFTLKEIGLIPVEGYANDVQVVGDIVYLTDWLEGFLVYNVSNPANQSLLGSYECNNNINPAVKGAKTFLVRGDYAIVGFQHAGLKILDISDPTTLELVGEYFGSRDTYHIQVVDDLVYMAMEYDGLQIIDISDVTRPTKVGEFNNGNPLFHIHVIGNIAYLRDYGQNHTLCLDVTDPSNITEIKQFDWGAYNIAMDDNIGYLCAIAGGVLTYNFSDPTEPTFIDEYYDGGNSADIAISNNLAFVADVEDGLEILDITNPGDLVEIAQFNDGGRSRNVFVDGNVAYISEFEDGLEIIQLWDEEANSTDSTSNKITSFELVLVLLGFLALRVRVIENRRKKLLKHI